MSKVNRQLASGAIYLDIQKKARSEKRTTDELLHLYALEGFLDRLASSQLVARFVLKGGMLLAALDTRRPTRDVDFEVLTTQNDLETISSLVKQIIGTNLLYDDGLEFEDDSVNAEVIREEDEYAGVRVSLVARLATAKLHFHVDVNIGDPIWPAPRNVDLPRLLGGSPIELVGYPLHMVYAEKIVTAMQRGMANTRWRDFGDIYTLAHHHPISGDDLANAIQEVSAYRSVALQPLGDVLNGFAAIAQARWVAWRRKGFEYLPQNFDDVLQVVTDFADPVIAGQVSDKTWDHASLTWK